MNDPAHNRFLPSFIAQAEEEIEYSQHSGEYQAEAQLLQKAIEAVKTEDRVQLAQTVSEIRNQAPIPCKSILEVLLDTIEVEIFGKPPRKTIRCPSCGNAIPSVMDHVFLARVNCPTCHAEVVYSDEQTS